MTKGMCSRIDTEKNKTQYTNTFKHKHCMKKINKFFLMGTVALTGMAGVTSCSSDNEPSDNDQPGVAGQVVKTQFALNLPYANNGTRMTETNTQGGGNNFLGIERMRLFTYVSEPGAGVQVGSKVSLGGSENAAASDNAKMVYRDISIPVGTRYFTLYGTAIPQSSNRFEVGSIQSSSSFTGASTNTEDFTFNLEPIKGSGNLNNADKSAAILDALNKVLDTHFTDEEGETIYWSDLRAAASSSDKYAYNLYQRFIKLTAGSANSVKSTLQGLMNQTGVTEGTTSLLAMLTKNCKEAIESISDNDFPRNLNLPDGIAKLRFDDTTNQFAYDTNTSVGMGENKIDYTKITYPASLNYFVSTKSMVTDKALINLTDLPDYSDWTNKDKVDDAWASKNFTEGAVQNSTRSIGLKDAIQYAVANMKLSIKCKERTLEDNAKAQSGGNEVENQQIEVPAAGYPVTAVLIGGQPSKVGWDYKPLADEKFEYTIYDKDINDSDNLHAKVDTKSPYNYTLVLDNENPTGDKNVVYVTVELTNTGKAFYGSDGLVPENATFYLLGKLDMENLGQLGSNNNNVDHIFVKDYTTTVDLTIASLKNAYNCIPDLRSSLLSLGLAVDLTWQEGITFDVTIE